ncbi:hypothetical protein GGR50DRAFT_658142 [Xylaria sp. CBS 124048]|nr:hypothetical protein GGR50DRAFT_658142 [Xylaria sp. CBS 124048]
MSGANSWLQRQRKTDLAELALHTGLKNFDSLKKAELELALDDYLARNADLFHSDPKLANYYASRARTIGSPIKTINSPVKRDVDGQSDKPKPTRRRVIKAVEEVAASASPESSEAETSTPTTVVHTPSHALSLTNRITLPATPADVASAVDRSTVALRTRVASVYKESGITEVTLATRETLSTVNSVLFAITTFELYFLRPEILADRYAFTIPAISYFGTSDYPVFLPDMFLLLTASFWSPALLWAFTSVFLPSIAGYFINMTAGAHRGRVTRRSTPVPDAVVDPLTFSIVKALISFVIYGQGVTFRGWVNDISIARINAAVYGGYKGILTGAAISGIFSIYDAVLNK